MKALLSITIFSLSVLGLAKSLPPDDEYVIVKDGHLYHHGERVRFWGAVGNFPGKKHEDNEAVVRRLKALGFNMIRFWREPQGNGSYVKGDGSRNDLIDHFLWVCEQNDIKIWYAGLNNLGKAKPNDVSVLQERRTEEAWKKAIDDEGKHIRNHLARIWDPRLELLGIQRMKTIAGHVNQYNGLRYADDPNIAIWELSNEEWWFWRIKSRLAEVPGFFQKQLTREWNDFTHKKYPQEDILEKAWLGLLSFESYKKYNIRLLPLRNTKVDWQGRVLGVNIQDGVAHQYGIDDFNRQRGADVIEFLLQKWLDHKRREAKELKAFGKSIAMGSLVWDTGIGSEIQAQFLQQQADAVAHCTYLNGFHHDPGHQRYPWYSGLEELPRMAWDKPWLEQNRVEGKPFFVYETQIHNPAKYRAEYPMRIASLGSIQDWDVVIWHYFGQAPDAKEKYPYSQPLDYTIAGENHPHGLHFQYDEVQQSSMVMAGEVFKNFLLSPATNPTTFVFGKEDLYDPLNLENRGYYYDMMDRFSATTFRYGSRIFIDTTRAVGEISGPNYMGRVYEINPICPTEEIRYDWQRGHLTFDGPAVAMYTGFFGQYGSEYIHFTNGLKIQNVSVRNPENTPYPVSPAERYVTLACVSTDRKPLIQSNEILIAAVSTSFNSGFSLSPEKLRREFAWTFKENAGATVSTGDLPILVSRVDATIHAPFLRDMYYEVLDFHLEPIKTGNILGDSLQISGNDPVFLIRLFKKKNSNQ
ncbi:MAG: hypothetical protein KI790_21175 [Cyclobacteriaceae bacterium]|nr:hypothetical protein [Cyclobacteriaceae bacterium HetDA_MAG_MS6]